MRCKNCRTKMKPRMAFCPKCGTPVTNGKRVALSDKQKKIELNRCAMACEGCGAVFSLT